MSKFIVQHGQEANSESDEQSENSEEEEQPQSRFTNLKFESSSESEEESTRVVRTMEDKRMEAFRTVLVNMKNHQKINDFALLQDDFSDLNKALEKSKQLVEKEGIPKIYFKGLALVEDAMEEVDKKTLGQHQQRVLNVLRNRVKKHNKQYETELAEYRKNPLGSDEEIKNKEEEKKPSKKQEEDEEDEDEDKDESKDENESDREESSDEESRDRSKMTPQERRLKWVKKTPKTKQLAATPVPTQKPANEEGNEIKGGDAEGYEEDFKETVITEKDEINFEITDDNIRKYIQNVSEKRGKSGYDPLLYIRNFARLLPNVKAFETRIELLVSLLKIRSEATQSVGETIMTLRYWNDTYGNLNDLYNTLQEHPDYIFSEANVEEDSKGKESSDEDEDKPKAVKKFQANILAYLELLDNFLTFGMKGEEPKSIMYLQWLKNESRFLILAEKIMGYYKSLNNKQAQIRLALVFLDRLHYKHDSLLKLMRDKSASATKQEYYFEENMKGKIDSLSKFVYENGNNTDKIKTMLYQSFHHALHGRFYEARDLFLRVGQQQLHSVKLQIYYNRALVQLGLAAFQCGYTQLVVECLSDIMTTMRLREILAQGISVSIKKEKTAKQEQDEIKKLLPYHMHMNLDLIEACYLISTMLIEVPNIAKQRHAQSETSEARHFRKVMQDFERRNVLGIPHDTVKDIVAKAVHSLQEGNWKECFDLIQAMPAWTMYRDSKDAVLASLKLKIKKAGLLAYVYGSLPHYSSYNMETLAEIFELEETEVSKVITREIVEDHIKAGLDTEKRTVSIFEKGKSQIQYLAETVTEKVTMMVENNERLVTHMRGGKNYIESKRSGGFSGGNPFIPAYKRNMGVAKDKSSTKYK